MDERKHLNISIQTNLPHDTFHTKSSISYIKVRCEAMWCGVVWCAVV
jgi:hypothetical protein